MVKGEEDSYFCSPTKVKRTPSLVLQGYMKRTPSLIPQGYMVKGEEDSESLAICAIFWQILLPFTKMPARVPTRLGVFTSQPLPCILGEQDWESSSLFTMYHWGTRLGALFNVIPCIIHFRICGHKKSKITRLPVLRIPFLRLPDSIVFRPAAYRSM